MSAVLRLRTFGFSLSTCALSSLLAPAVAQEADEKSETWQERNARIAEAVLARATDEEWERLADLRERIVESTASLDEAAMDEYRVSVPKAREAAAKTQKKDYWRNPFSKLDAALEMLPIPGGSFLMGSPPDEELRWENEGPQVEVEISPFWMARYETTWNLYEPFMLTSVARNKDGTLEYPEHYEDAEPVDFVSSPTTPYTDMSFGMGRPRYPAVCMTHHAANKFCEWLSYQTGHYYRLPTEAEWEYACRAGTEGPYSIPAKRSLSEYAILDPEQVRVGYEKIGTRRPNPWGLYDMHGNVMEWCLDQLLPDAYARYGKGPVKNPVHLPETRYPRVARGGSWYDPEEYVRSAARVGSAKDWKVQDPQSPQSLWYLTDAQWLGFRVVRPLEVPSLEEMHLHWNIGLPIDEE